MGTIFGEGQPLRASMLGRQPRLFVAEMVEDAKRLGITFDQMLKVHELELRERELEVAILDGDYRDEHAAGYGEVLRGIAEAMGRVAEALSGRQS